MKALTVHQPWASMQLAGVYLWETRSWPILSRGTLVIHSGKATENLKLIQDDWPFIQLLGEPPFTDLPWAHRLPLGHVLGTVEVVDCLPTEMVLGQGLDGIQQLLGYFRPVRYAWKRTDPIPIQSPIPLGHLIFSG